jgi:hypothetical protein
MIINNKSESIEDNLGNSIITFTDSKRPIIAYTPRSDHWDVSIPENIIEAIDRLTQAVYVLQTNAAIGQATLEAPTNDNLTAVINGDDIEITGTVTVNASYGGYTLTWSYYDATANTNIGGDTITIPVGGGSVSITSTFAYADDPYTYGWDIDWDIDVYLSASGYVDSSTLNVGGTYYN